MTNILSKVVNAWLSPGNDVQHKSARGTLSSFVPGTYSQYGQPPPAIAAGDASGLITPQRMREVVLGTPTAAACLNAILDYSGAVEIDFRNIDPALNASKKQVKRIQKLLRRPNPTQTGRQFKLALFRDVITFGFGAVEIERDETGGVANLWVMDSARLRIDFDEHGTILGYDELDIKGQPVYDKKNPSDPHGWEPEDVLFFSLNPMSESSYPYSRITQIFTCAYMESLMLAFISGRFTESNAPYGIYDLGDINEDELESAMTQWNAQAKAEHRILLTGSKNGGKFTPFGYHLKDLDATGLLAEVRTKIMAIMGVTVNELGEAGESGKANGFNLSFTFKKRALEPLLNEFTETLTVRLLWDELGFDALEMYFKEIDTRDELIQVQIDESYVKMGVYDINTVANRKGIPDCPGGDVRMVFTGSNWLPLAQIEPLADALLAAEQAGPTVQSISAPGGADSVSLKPAQPSPTGAKPAAPSNLQKPQGAVHATRAVSGTKQKG
jgi:portal protein